MDPQSDEPSIAPSETPALHSAARTTSAPRLRRAAGVLLFMLGVGFLLHALYFYFVYVPREENLQGIMIPGFAAVVLIGLGVFLVRSTGPRIAEAPSVGLTPWGKRITGQGGKAWVFIAACGGIAAFVSVCLPILPSWIADTGGLLGLFGGAFLLIRAKQFVWRDYLICAFAIATALGSILCPSLTRVREIVSVRRREEGCGQIITVMKSLCTPEILREANKPISRSSNLSPPNGTLLVLQARIEAEGNRCDLHPSPLETRILAKFLSRDASSVRYVMIMAPPEVTVWNGPTGRPMEVAVPILLYSWPEKQLLLSGKVEVKSLDGCNNFEIDSRIAEALEGILARP